MSTVKVSVIVPVRNEAANIRRTLDCLLRQEFDANGFEVIVVEGRSEDATVEVVRRMQPRFGRLRLLYNPRRLSSAARNIGIRHARGQYVVIVDGHCALDNPCYLAE